MTRLQKKCIIGTAGFHLLLLLAIVVFGSGFFDRKPKPDNNTQLLDVIPANLVDAAVNSGVRAPQPPPPTPVQPKPQPPAPKPIVTPPPKPEPTMLEKIEKIFKSEPVKPAPTKPEDHKVQPDLHKMTRVGPKAVPNPAIAKTIKTLQGKLSKPVEIQPVGTSTVAYANYANVVRSVYDAAWTLPNSVAKDENIVVSVTIASDGTVISSKIVSPSGDAPADDSVQKALDRVQFIAPFPEGTTDKERTFNITFNPQVKSTE